ncbi:MAG: nickel pincer cofactor biosynthesis protein LarB [Magnetococcales bacterium]|nr:nickel pincer cofactor biosynthesis protein LarB [Magnetococcales bacterium]
MSPKKLRALLKDLAQGKCSIDDTLAKLASFPMEEIHNKGATVARLDTHRHLRQGFPEVILAEGKRFGDLKAIIQKALGQEQPLLITRLSKKRIKKLQKIFPQLRHEAATRSLYRAVTSQPACGLVGVFCAGTSDIGVAQEAALTARLMGARVETHYDAGVAGIHRLFAARSLLQSARVLIVVAGMEGALPSVVGGLVNRPVIAVPTSVGYGTAFGGVSALLGMLNSCSANVTVVNIDNGFGAGFVAGLINRDHA